MSKYVQSIPELESKISSDPVATLALVTPDTYNFGSGPWWLMTQCTSDVQKQLATGTDAGFTAYLGCIGVSATADRMAYWNRAKKAWGLP